MTARSGSRRTFLKTSTVVALGGGLWPYHGASSSARAESANDKLGIGAIGVGGRGSRLGAEIAGYGNMVACADVHRGHAEAFAAKLKTPCQTYGDYRQLLERKDVEIVTIATPDHWHVKIAVDALQAGKDVYCEKPLTLTIDEGKILRKVVQQTGRVLQVGTQQRSTSYFLTAVALARSGRLGKKLTATCSIGPGHTCREIAPTDPPPELDWDMWLGQAPKVPYCRERAAGFRWWLEYSGGKLTDWGAHHVDIAQWALGCENTGPIEVEGKGKNPCIPEDFDPVAFFAGKAKLPNCYNVAIGFHIDLQFANGNRIHVQEGDQDNGILLEGELGRIFVNRRRVSGKPIEELTSADQQWLQEEYVKLCKGRAPTTHVENFLACVKGRAEPISDVATNHRGISSCHLCNIAILLGRKLRWDPVREDFVSDAQASALVGRPQRPPYVIQV